MKSENRYPIGFVAARCGMTPHVIRAWERRYGAVEPERTPTNRRLYSEADIERLQLLKEATDAGNSISQIAGLEKEALIVAASHKPIDRTSAGSAISMLSLDSDPVAHIDACRAAIIKMDAHELDMALSRAAIALPEISLLKNVVAPLIQKIGDLWYEGSLKVFNEHMAMTVIRSFLGDMLRSAEIYPQAPNMVVTTPVRQMHEFGALLISAAAVTLGWRVTYLGPNLPAEEISAAVTQTSARLVALSIVHPPDDPRVNRELLKLTRYLDVPLIVGGRAASAYKTTLKKIKAITIDDIADLPRTLASL